MNAKNVLLIFFHYLACNAIDYTLMKSNATCSGLILSFTKENPRSVPALDAAKTRAIFASTAKA